MSNGGMSSTESIGFKVVTMGRDDVDSRLPTNLKSLTLANLLEWIDSQPIDDRLKQELKKAASKYPQQALGSFKKNFRKHLTQASIKNQASKSQPKVELVELAEESEDSEIERTFNESDFTDKVPFNDEFDFGLENN